LAEIRRQRIRIHTIGLAGNETHDIEISNVDCGGSRFAGIELGSGRQFPSTTLHRPEGKDPAEGRVPR